MLEVANLGFTPKASRPIGLAMAHARPLQVWPLRRLSPSVTKCESVALISPLIEFAQDPPVERLVLMAPEMSAHPGGSVPPDLWGNQTAPQPLTAADRLPVSTKPSIAHWESIGKTVIDRCVAVTVLLLLTPLLLLIALAIRLDSAGPVIFTQKRHGYRGRDFAIFKFRTMRCNKDGHDGQRQTLRRDSRVTRVGDFLRRTSLDELPQLWNVLNGTMSLVGPRPHPVTMRTEGRLGEEIAADYQARHRVKPGITGLAQINGNRGATTTADQLRNRIAYDIQYIDTWSLMLDIRILLITPVRLVTHRANAF